MIIFDYIFYRTCKYYSNTNIAFPETLGWLIVGLIQLLLFVNIIMFIRLFGGVEFPKNATMQLGIPVFIILEFLSRFRYQKFNYDFFVKKWDSAKHQRLLGIMTFILCFGVLIVPISIAIWEYLSK